MKKTPGSPPPRGAQEPGMKPDCMDRPECRFTVFKQTTTHTLASPTRNSSDMIWGLSLVTFYIVRIYMGSFILGVNIIFSTVHVFVRDRSVPILVKGLLIN